MGKKTTLKNQDLCTDEILHDWNSAPVEIDLIFTHNKEKDILSLYTVSLVLPGASRKRVLPGVYL